MKTPYDKTQENKNQLVANAVTRKQSNREPAFQFVDNRPEAIQMQKLQKMANNSLRAMSSGGGSLVQRVIRITKRFQAAPYRFF